MTAPKKTHHLKVLVLGRGSEQNTELCEFIILWKAFRSASPALGLHFRSQELHAHLCSADASARSLIVSSLSTCSGRPEKTCLSVEGCWQQSEFHATLFPLSFPSSFLLSSFCPLFISLFPFIPFPSFYPFLPSLHLFYFLLNCAILDIKCKTHWASILSLDDTPSCSGIPWTCDSPAPV